VKQDGSGHASTSRRIEELNVLMLEIETVADNVVTCWNAGLRNFRGANSTKKIKDSVADGSRSS
jgi:hypothetical protein